MPSAPEFTSWDEAVRWLRSQPGQARLIRDAYYDDPLIAAAERYWASEEWKAIRGVLRMSPGSRVLDVGAGRGISSFAFAKDGYIVTSLEPDGSDLVGAGAIRRLATVERISIDVVQEASERLPFEDGSFDVVFGRAVLHHVQDLAVACSEFYRVLKLGGQLIMVREHVISHPRDLAQFLRAHPLHQLYGGENAFPLKHYVHAIQRAGFDVKAIIPPLRSAINYAPYTKHALQVELAARLTSRSSFLTGVMVKLLRLPWVWQMVVGVAERMDNRPGRLYSFVAER